MSGFLYGGNFGQRKKRERRKRGEKNGAKKTTLFLFFFFQKKTKTKTKNSTAWTIDAEAKALRHVSASTAALIYSSEPLGGAAFASIFLGERLVGARAWIGAALVVGSSLVAQVGGAAGKERKKR